MKSEETGAARKSDLSDELGGSLPVPRLQFRWAANPEPGSQYQWLCHYELVLPLREHDIRREKYGDDGELVGKVSELVVSMGAPSKRGSNHAPCRDTFDRPFFDDPCRDGAHASWDSEALGGLPIFAVDLDGNAIPKPPNT